MDVAPNDVCNPHVNQKTNPRGKYLSQHRKHTKQNHPKKTTNKQSNPQCTIIPPKRSLNRIEDNATHTRIGTEGRQEVDRRVPKECSGLGDRFTTDQARRCPVQV